MELKNAVPWGRSLAEYKKMFCLSEHDLTKSILGCGDGPASFNAELTKLGGSVTSIDPVYSFSHDQLKSRIDEVYDEVMPQMKRTKSNYLWSTIPSVEELGIIRMAAMNTFLADYEQGKQENRYIDAALPKLPFETQQFNLAVCSHYLFLYSEQLSLQQHLDAILELNRVAKEVRIYPLTTLKGELSEHVEPLLIHLAERNIKCTVSRSEYRFQKNAVNMLTITP